MDFGSLPPVTIIPTSLGALTALTGSYYYHQCDRPTGSLAVLHVNTRYALVPQPPPADPSCREIPFQLDIRWFNTIFKFNASCFYCAVAFSKLVAICWSITIGLRSKSTSCPAVYQTTDSTFSPWMNCYGSHAIVEFSVDWIFWTDDYVNCVLDPWDCRALYSQRFLIIIIISPVGLTIKHPN
jgi:hypothetical protein